MRIVRRVLIVLVVILLIMQFFRIDKVNPVSKPSLDFIVMVQPDAETTQLLKSACYDCHSNATVYPWYTNIAPVSWWLKHHVDEGRAELNFSTWGSYSDKKAAHKLEECIELVKIDEMPLDSYTWTHADAKLSHEQRVKLTGFLDGLR